MTNNDEFKDWTTQVEQEDKAVIDALIEHKIKTLRRAKNLRWAAIPLTSVMSLLIAFALLVNLNDVFYVYAISNPILKPLTQLVNGRQDILSAFDSGYVQLVDQTITVGDYTLEVDSIISDTRSINLFYKVRYQGELLSDDMTDLTAPFHFFTLDNKQISLAYQLKYVKDYRWAELYLTDLNTYQPFVIRFMPYGQDSTVFGNMTIVIDQTKAVEPKIIPINKTLIVAGQKLILKSLEVGAFQTRLGYTFHSDNFKILNQISFKDSTGGFLGSEDPSGPNTYFAIFAIGQMSNQPQLSIELSNAYVLDKAFETVCFDPKTRTFEALPDYLSFSKVEVDGNNYELTFTNQQGVMNQMMMPISDNVVDLSTWGRLTPGETTLGFTLSNDQLVTFKVLTGTVVSNFPNPISISLK